jgi:ubiquinone/menaquinone biosynthesis C-methylase UbiE
MKTPITNSNDSEHQEWNHNANEMYERFLVPAKFLPQTQILFLYANPQPGERVIDVACGTGVISRSIAPLIGTGGHISAVDISAEMLAVARALPQPDGARISWQEGSALNLPYDNGSFDLALCQQGLQFFPDKITAMREMRRVLAPNGRVVVSVWESVEKSAVYSAINDRLVAQSGLQRYLPRIPMAIPLSYMRFCLRQGSGEWK